MKTILVCLSSEIRSGHSHQHYLQLCDRCGLTHSIIAKYLHMNYYSNDGKSQRCNHAGKDGSSHDFNISSS